jgi:predicted DNA-binding transcriptional regulator AlpA
MALTASAGGDVLLRGPDVAAVLGVSLATLYRMIDAGQFSRPISPSPGVRAWPMSVVQAFIKQLAGEGATDAR